jgi:anti-anti-sigma factor
MTLLEMRVEEHGGMSVLLLTGELDISSAGRVEKELARIEDGAPGPLALDLSGLQFMDSTGLRVVLAAHTASDRGVRIACKPGGPIGRLFDAMFAGKHVRLYDSRADALADL